jgi:hypothetical protein
MSLRSKRANQSTATALFQLQQMVATRGFSRDRRRHLGRSSWYRECAVEATRRWREENAELVKQMNERRRLGERQRDCVDCGESFTFKSSVAVRCPSCRRQRKLERRRLSRSVG